MCGSHSEAETQVGFIIIYFIYLDFQMVVALTSSTVYDITFKGFQLATWLALLLYVLFLKGGYGYSSEYFMDKDLKDINLTRMFKTWWHGAIDKEMTLKDWGSNTSRSEEVFYLAFFGHFVLFCIFLLYFFTYWLASIYSYCCPITALRGVAINALSTFYVCDLFKFSLHYFLISRVE